ncbi:MAG: response regulator [Cyclobacteriaceae bacterium]|nr:response regulator [Cyclobacteriaceae bacterium]
MNIYLVEDDSIYAEFIKKSLAQNQAYKINHFLSAEDALKAIKNGLRDGIIIIDYKLPGMSGIELYESIKGNVNGIHKVIMLSAIDDGNMVLSFIQKGVRDYVIKNENVIESLVAVLEGRDDDYLFN